MATKRKPASVYEATRDRPETFDELVTDYVAFKKLVHKLIRETNARVDKLVVDYKHTNKRVHELESKGRAE